MYSLAQSFLRIDKQNPDEGYRSRFSHNEESASPGYYSVKLQDYDITAELTCTERVGVHKYTFSKSDESNILIDPTNKIFGKAVETSVKLQDEDEIVGYCKSTGWGGDRTVYFVAKFSKPYKTYGVFVNGKYQANEKTTKGPDAKVWATFDTKEGESVEVKVAISAVSIDGAKKNMLAEAEGKSFDDVHAEARAKWESQLSKVMVSGGSEDEKTIFYTGLYHCFIAPNLYMDVDGSYMAVGELQHASESNNYSTFSLWDTFRATHPLFTILEQEKTVDFAKSLISRKIDSDDHMPMWELCGFDNTCMIGYHSVSVIWDAICKDIPGIDLEEAYEAMKDIAFVPKKSSSDGSSGIQNYIDNDYMTSDIDKSVSKTLENCYDDWCIAQLAKKLGKEEDYKYFMDRSIKYINLYHPEKKCFWPRKKDGTWVSGINTHSWDDLLPHYISGNLWDYEYHVLHDIDKLVDLKGGKEAFVQSLDDLFNSDHKMEGGQHVDISGFVGMYAHGDEPGHHIPYLYNYGERHDKTCEIVDFVRKEMYSNAVDGMINNEDCGQMSAWYIFSAMGFYPVCPGKPVYDLGTPLFDKVTLNLENGNKFVIEAENLSKENIYVDSVTVNGKKLEGLLLKHSDIVKGGEMKFFMKNK